ncbi:acyl-CoA dehydrogenase family protein [Salinibaculum salinum]|uniref:acyl-CoA dehydrogenase family protein n=1 Tax=Salinibaculum salinum TaxID=3131996 RepID=UPI0030EB9CAE
MTREPLEYGQLAEGKCNYWAWDPTVRYEARRVYPDGEFEWAERVLDEYGAAVGETIADNSDIVDRNEPELHTYDGDGEVQNHVEYHPLQFENERITYDDFRLTHDAFHAPPNRNNPVGLLHPLTMQTLLCYTDVGFACPASMTVGAAIVLDKFDDGSLDDYFQGLTAADSEDHIEGAMFLTEKQGGSDVGANETLAVPQADGEGAATLRADGDVVDAYELTGEKWFCSNIDAQGALVLARTPDAPDGTDGLSLFLVPRELPDGTLNAATFRRLKDKLGTLSVPTGEIEFEGATGYLVGEEGNGFRQMTEMLNYERLTNATGAVGVMGRALLEAKVHAANRAVFGETIQEYPLLRRDLVEMTVDYEAAAAFAFESAKWYDRRERAERGSAINSSGGEPRERQYPDDEGLDAYKLMRLLVPIAKYRTGEMVVDTCSYAMEVLGGNGYVRDRITHRLLRDAQVLPIWEGTSNILSLDVLRALDREDAHEALFPLVTNHLDAAEHSALEALADTVEAAFHDLQTALATLAGEDTDYAQYHAKRLADLIFDVVSGAILVAEAQHQLDEADNARKALVAEWFVRDRFESEDADGITSGETPGDDHFDAIARYGSVPPERLVRK